MKFSGCLKPSWFRIACCLLSPVSSLAVESSIQETNDLSLEELVAVKVTSVSKREQNLNDAAAAISVLSNEDLRRSGATSIVDALRLVPGLNVASVNSSQRSVSARGFNNLYANKLLVLVDGRAVYTPLFSGVYWDLQQTMLDDVDRVEVIRGPGATLWGANAVNGVINIVTRSAKDTQGGLTYGGGGSEHLAMGGSRYGGQLDDNTYYRVFGSYQLNDDYPLANGRSAHDGWQGGQGGFRIDRYPQADTHLTWQGDATIADIDDHSSTGYNVNTVGRWTRQLSERSSVEAQAYYDRTDRDEITRSHNTVDTFDISLQHTFGLGERNDVIWGAGYRYILTKVEQTSPIAEIHDGNLDQQLFSVFLQDEFKIWPDRFSITAGTKAEHNDFTGFEIQPSIRAVFKPTENQTLWAAVSRAVRTPNEIEGRDVFAIAMGAPIPGPGGGMYIPTIISGRDVNSEVLWAYELGYRIQPAKRLSIDATAFYNDYDRIINLGFSQFVPGSPYGTAEIEWQNNTSAHSYGGELSITFSPMDNWRLIASYSLLKREIFGNPMLMISDPQQQVSLRSSYDFTKQLSFDAQLRFVDQFEQVPFYVTADARLAYRPTERLEFSIVGQNLFDNHHPEQAAQPLMITSEVPRGVYGKVTWRF